MKNKKIMALALSLLLSLGSLGACSTNKSNDSNTQSTADTEQVTTADTSSQEVTLSSAPYTKGTVTNNIYTNTWADISLRIPGTWTLFDDYELCSMMQLEYDFDDPLAYTASAAKLADIYDMYAYDPVTNSSIYVLLQDLKLDGNEGMSAAEYLNLKKSELVSENATYTTGEITDIVFSAQSYSMMKADITPNEGDPATTYFFLREIQGRMMTVAITFPSDNPIDPDTIFA